MSDISFVKKIDNRLLQLTENCKKAALKEAMAYSVCSGGKRLRPTLLLAVCEAFKGSITDAALDFACALEMIHTYSLIHDDLPAMDNDDFRRGMPTNHKKFGEALAILAGDALLNRAFETMACVCANDPNTKNLNAMLAITSASGDNGMIAGQVDDIYYQNKKLDKDILSMIHAKKTGALFSAAFEAGALCGGASEADVATMKSIGEKIGVAFQILDDLLDVTSTSEELGKPVNSDERNDKNTYVSIHGIKKTQNDYEQITGEIIDMINKIPKKTDTLQSVVQQLIDRKK